MYAPERSHPCKSTPDPRSEQSSCCAAYDVVETGIDSGLVIASFIACLACSSDVWESTNL